MLFLRYAIWMKHLSNKVFKIEFDFTLPVFVTTICVALSVLLLYRNTTMHARRVFQDETNKSVPPLLTPQWRTLPHNANSAKVRQPVPCDGTRKEIVWWFGYKMHIYISGTVCHNYFRCCVINYDRTKRTEGIRKANTYRSLELQPFDT